MMCAAAFIDFKGLLFGFNFVIVGARCGWMDINYYQFLGSYVEHLKSGIT